MTMIGRKAGLAAWLLLPLMTAPSLSADRLVRFKPGATAATLKGVIRGSQDATFVLQSVEGQVLQTLLAASNRSCHFNLFEPGQTNAVHIGSVAGNEFGRNPTKAGDYRVQIYLMRNAARRNEACRYSLSVELTGRRGGASAGVSDRQMRDACRARAGGIYAVTSARIRTAAVGSGGEGPSIDGTANKGREGIKRFRCLFTPDRQLRDVMTMTPDGE